ncbi:MAG TPA: hypothetical protein VEA37_10710 [Flavobacterium sp.]|nr:hypothetical protein [Flavobacterium sp.]
MIDARDFIEGFFAYKRQKKVYMKIPSTDFWIKVTGMLQQNWALIEAKEDKYIIWFIGDTSVVFDKLEYESLVAAEFDLKINGFEKYDSIEDDFKQYVNPPRANYRWVENDIYSSGKYWRFIHGIY